MLFLFLVLASKLTERIGFVECGQKKEGNNV